MGAPPAPFTEFCSKKNPREVPQKNYYLTKLSQIEVTAQPALTKESHCPTSPAFNNGAVVNRSPLHKNFK